jgi:hypothetical protein
MFDHSADRNYVGKVPAEEQPMKTLAVASLGLILSACNSSAEPARFQAGYWEQSSRIVATEDAPEKQVARNRCITPREAAQPASLFEAAARASGCELRGFTMSGGEIHGSRICNAIPGPGHMHETGTIEGHYSATSYEMTIREDVQADGGVRFQTETRTTGRRAGDCPAT